MLPSSPLPPLRLSAPALSGRPGAALTLSTVARLVASGAAVSKADLVPASGLARTTVSTAVDELLDRGLLRLDGTRPTPGRGRPADRLALAARGGHVLLADLVPASGLARTTVSTAVDELLDRGLLRLDGTRPTPGRGRPADRLALAARGGHVLLADCGARGAHLAVVDLSQRVLAHEHVDLDVRDGPDAVLDVVESRLAALRAEGPRGVPTRAVVIGLPGPVDGHLGIPVRPPIMPGWHAYPVSARLERRFGCPAVLENDVNLRALGEARAVPPTRRRCC